jgi:hypothetical protein
VCGCWRTTQATTYPLFNGFTPDEWPQEYDGSNHDSTVTLRCVDGFFVLNQKAVNVSAYAQAVETLGPVLWWRLGETNGTVAQDVSGNGFDGTYINFAATLAPTNGLVAFDADGAQQFKSAQYVNVVAQIDGGESFGTIEFWFSTTTTTQSVMFEWGIPIENVSSRIYVNASGQVGMMGGKLSALSYNDGVPHHLAMDLIDGSFLFCIDGVAVSTSNDPNTFGTATVYGASAGACTDGSLPFDGTLDEVVVYPQFTVIYTAATALANFQAGSAPFDADLTGARLARVLDGADWPTADRDIATGQSTLGPQTLNGSSLGLAKVVEASEQGRFFISADGLATLQDRYVSIGGTSADATSTTSQATFSDQGGTDLPYSNQGFRLKKAPIRNTVTGQRDGGSSITRSDSTSTTSYLERPWSVGNLANSNDDDVRALLEHQLARYAQPVTICDGITIEPQSPPNGSWTAAQLWAAVLGMEISKRYTLERRPQGIGNTISLDVLLEGVAHNITPMSWRCTPFFSAADTRTDWMILDTGQLDTNVLCF